MDNVTEISVGLFHLFLQIDLLLFQDAHRFRHFIGSIRELFLHGRHIREHEPRKKRRE